MYKDQEEIYESAYNILLLYNACIFVLPSCSRFSWD